MSLVTDFLNSVIALYQTGVAREHAYRSGVSDFRV